MPTWSIESIPNHATLETRKILKILPQVHASLAELKGVAASIPSQSILMNTLALQEARDSSAIENIITTQDALFKAELDLKSFGDLAAKEVQNYNRALQKGVSLVKSRGLITNSTIIDIQEEIERNNAGFRRVPGTELKNAITGATIYTPPQDYDTIMRLMADLQNYINDDEINDYDPLVKMAIIHYQFESIHPFYDGNGRTGRIINILYLIMRGLLNLPILYHSSYIINYKSEYYRLFQEVREQNQWENWILFMVRGVGETAIRTIEKINAIRNLMRQMKSEIRKENKFYSQDLLNTLFQHPYTKIEFVMRDLHVSRLTAANYLNTLAQQGFLRKDKLGKSNYYVNEELMKILNKN
ncbi:Fic family protein [Lewinella aquimaris]|uniref:Fic family protein n=1 Tax=Neolewinella aquimaris TaxID=1835722 RepID=A0A840EJS2_9BACT|nr:Fic family protein [Neolewinella aquimaris]MBB4081126.1 Fic family protein [Neolewinella aquimaris]